MRPRIAIYSHDAMGLGHLRRNLLIAEALAAPPVGADVLLVSGAQELNAYRFPPRVDCLTLPALQKYPDGTYGTRSLSLPLEDLLHLRAGQILEAMRAYRPDLLLVDKVPRGIFGELQPALTHLREEGRARVVLGIRDVLDDPEAVRREWRAVDNEACVRDHYDAVWVYGDRSLHDPLRPMDLGEELASRVEFTGYLDPRRRTARGTNRIPVSAGHRLALCELGGGQDGGFLAERFLEAGVPEGWEGILLTGPFMPAETRERLRRVAESTPRVRLVEFVSDPESLVTRADRIISMGGYNTMTEVVTSGTPALVVPRITPRSEQAIRAELFRERGLIDVLRPEEATSDAIAAWLARPTPNGREILPLDFGGLDRIPRLVNELLASRRPGAAPDASRKETA